MGLSAKHVGGIFITKEARCLFVLHPAASLLYLALLLVLIFSFSNPVYVITLFMITLALSVYFAGAKAVARTIKFFMPFGILFALVTPIFNHRGAHVLFYLFDKSFTVEALAYGIYTMLLLISSLMVFVTLNSVLPSGKLLYMLSAIAPQTAFIAGMSLRFMVILRNRAKEYAGVQRTRKRVYGSFLEQITDYGGILVSFSAWALEDGLLASETLRAKEYGVMKRTHYRSYKHTYVSVAFEAVSVAMFAAILFLAADEYDYFRSFTNISINPLAYALLVSYMLIPFAADILRRL